MTLIPKQELTDKIPCAQTPPKWLPAPPNPTHKYICCDARECPYQGEQTPGGRPLCIARIANPAFYETLQLRELKRQQYTH